MFCRITILNPTAMAGGDTFDSHSRYCIPRLSAVVISVSRRQGLPNVCPRTLRNTEKGSGEPTIALEYSKEVLNVFMA
jgi:hypothetical protein